MNGADYKLLHILNSNKFGYVYAENYQHQKILIYKSPHPFPPHSVFSSDQIDGSDILEVFFNCNQGSCLRFLNRRTNQLSNIYEHIIDYNDKQDIVAYYLRDKNLVIISQAFKPCKKPLTTSIQLPNGYEFSSDTQFLANGNLRLGYETETGKYIVKIISINFKQLHKDCDGKNNNF